MHMRIVPVRLTSITLSKVAGSNSALRRIIPGAVDEDVEPLETGVNRPMLSASETFSPATSILSSRLGVGFLREAGDQNAATGGKELVCNGRRRCRGTTGD